MFTLCSDRCECVCVISVTCGRVLAGAFNHSICPTECMCIYAFITYVCPSTKQGMWWSYKSPITSQSSSYNASHVLIQNSVTNGDATAWLSHGFRSWPYMPCTVAWMSHSAEVHYMATGNEQQLVAQDKLWNARTRTRTKHFLDCEQRLLWKGKRQKETERVLW